jgi:hypothetical protein
MVFPHMRLFELAPVTDVTVIAVFTVDLFAFTISIPIEPDAFWRGPVGVVVTLSRFSVIVQF